MSGAPSWQPWVFDRLYAAKRDPWNFETSGYERRKYDATLGMLPPGRRFGQALELGCSIGVFTRRLANWCSSLLAVDCAESALEQARARCQVLPHVRFARSVLPEGFPSGRFDLVVASEILYFFGDEDLARLASQVAAALHPGGLILLANWTGNTDTPCTGEAAATLFAAHLPRPLEIRRTVRDSTFRLDLIGSA